MSVIEAAKEFKSITTKLDFGCGPNKKQGFLGVDKIQFDGKVDFILDAGNEIWPWEDNSIEESHASHFLEHLTAQERIHFFNELYRVLRVGGKFTFVCPHWSSCRAYGDPTHVWPPMSEFALYYVQKTWRMQNAPHTDIKYNPKGFNCNFEAIGGFSIRQDLLVKNQEYIQFAQQNYKEACQDIFATLTKTEMPSDTTGTVA